MTELTPTELNAARRALEFTPAATWIMTSAHGGTRSGQVVRWVQRCAEEPLLVSVSVKKCHPIEPLIRDSHSFGLCLLDNPSRASLKAFEGNEPPDEEHDPFAAMRVELLRTGSPILTNCVSALDCEVMRHMDIEADYELYIGQVVASRVQSEAARAS